MINLTDISGTLFIVYKGIEFCSNGSKRINKHQSSDIWPYSQTM